MVKIRLARRGRKDMAMYSIVVADARAPRDGRFIEKIGTYNPQHNPASVQIKKEEALAWLAKGAQPTLIVRNLLSSQGIMLKKHLQTGVRKGAITQAEADKRFDTWENAKELKKSKVIRYVVPTDTKDTTLAEEPTKPDTSQAKDTATDVVAKKGASSTKTETSKE